MPNPEYLREFLMTDTEKRRGTMRTIALRPCEQHIPTRKDIPPCFHNFGGHYEVLRELPCCRMVVLRHIPSGSIGLARHDELLAPPLIITAPVPVAGSSGALRATAEMAGGRGPANRPGPGAGLDSVAEEQL